MKPKSLIERRKEREKFVKQLQQKRLEKRIREVMPDKPLRIGSIEIL